MKLELCYYPSDILRRRAKEAGKNEMLRPYVDALVSLMQTHRVYSMAAPQVGLGLRLIVVNSDMAAYGRVMSLINPKVVKMEGHYLCEEGCLAFPNTRFRNVPRAERVTIQASGLTGKPLRFRADGPLAQLLQHEMDHLNGILLIDKREEAPLVPH